MDSTYKNVVLQFKWNFITDYDIKTYSGYDKCQPISIIKVNRWLEPSVYILSKWEDWFQDYKEKM